MSSDIQTPTGAQPRQTRIQELAQLAVCYFIITILAGFSMSGHDPNSGFLACSIFVVASGFLMFVPSPLTRIISFIVLLVALAGLWESKLDAERRIQRYRKEIHEQFLRFHPSTPNHALQPTAPAVMVAAPSRQTHRGSYHASLRRG